MTEIKKLSFFQSLSIATSSTAPLYSLVVTSILMFPLVGGLGVPLVYLLAVIPSLLVCYSMRINNTAITSKGSVYSWSGTGKISWLSGFALMVSGIICTAGLGIYAAEVLIGENKPFRSLLIASIIIIIGVTINYFSVKMTTIIQNVGMIIQVIALIAIGYDVYNNASLDFTINGSISDWSHAFILALFAFWGFDAVFALSEETKEKVPNNSSITSIGIILTFFMFGSLLFPSVQNGEIVNSTLFGIALAISAITAIGSTVIPTVRGIEAMADNHELPKLLQNRSKSSILVATTIILWMILSVFINGFFWDSIEAISIFVGFYFTISALSAWKRTKQSIHMITTIIMTTLTIIVLTQMFKVDYGETSFMGVIGGVGIIVTLIAIFGLLMTLVFTKNNEGTSLWIRKREEEESKGQEITDEILTNFMGIK